MLLEYGELKSLGFSAEEAASIAKASEEYHEEEGEY